MSETVLNQEEQKAEPSVGSKKRKNGIKQVIGLFLSAVMIALTAYVLTLQNQNYRTISRTTEMLDAAAVAQSSNYRSYVAQYKDTKIKLEDTTRRLEEVQKALDQANAELLATKGMLSETQTMLSQAQTENLKLKHDIQELEALRGSENVQNVAELEAKINALKQKNADVTRELNNVNGELRAFNADFTNMEEGRNLLALFQSKIRLVKSRMRYLNQQAFFARVAAQKERDRLETLNGNSGYLTKDGKLVQPGKSADFDINVKMVQ